MKNFFNNKSITKFFNDGENYLPTERLWIFLLLALVGGYFGGFTYFLRGRVFCNAQTGNLVLLAYSIGQGDTQMINYTLLSLTSYILGVVVSEYLMPKINKSNFFRWETLFIFFEILVTIYLGFIPETAPFQITQLAICFITAMQFNTFKQAHGMGMATTFCTNHVKQFASNFVKYKNSGNKRERDISFSHLAMILAFLFGAVLSVVLGKFFLGKSIWISSVLLSIIFINFFFLDIKRQK